MPIKWTRTLVRIGNSWRLTLPKELCDSKGWKEGDVLTITATNGDVLVSKERIPRGTIKH